MHMMLWFWNCDVKVHKILTFCLRNLATTIIKQWWCCKVVQQWKILDGRKYWKIFNNLLSWANVSCYNLLSHSNYWCQIHKQQFSQCKIDHYSQKGKFMCRNPSLGLATKARACKGAGQEWARESHFMLQGTQESVRGWTLTLPNKFPLWELESKWILEFSKGDCRGQNSLYWEVPYIIGKLLKRRCQKKRAGSQITNLIPDH
jgi:hypothetical protein